MDTEKSVTNLPQNQQKQEILRIKRPCLVVADLQKSLEVYRDILGFRLDYVSEASPDSYLYKIFEFPESANVTFAALSTEDEPRALALTEVKNIAFPQATAPHRIALVVRVEEVTQTINQVAEIGLKIIEPNYFKQPPNLSFTEQAFFDYDGHLIMLYDVTVGN
ncbi:MAG: VOC family protein [Cyanobacteria bacterium P01_A01_bin.84]